MSFDLLLDQQTNDLVIKDRDLQFTKTKEEEIVQRVGMKLRTFQGEWFLDTTYGIPYLQQIISRARRPQEVDAIFISEIRNIEGVNRIIDYKSNFDRTTRLYEINLNIATDFGDIFIAFKNPPQREFIYPSPAPNDPRVDCTNTNLVPFINQFYYFVNFIGLPPSTGLASWQNDWA